MLRSAFDLGERINNRKLTYIVHSELWQRFQMIGLDLSFSAWSSIKYLNDDGSNYSDEINQLPNNKGGLYLFYVKCPLITGITEYPFYVGRAQLTRSQSLRKRVKEYFSKFALNNERPKITRMIQVWGPELHVAYIVLEDNPDIIDLEKKLINALLLPMNDEIPDQEIRQAIKAFS